LKLVWDYLVKKIFPKQLHLLEEQLQKTREYLDQPVKPIQALEKIEKITSYVFYMKDPPKPPADPVNNG